MVLFDSIDDIELLNHMRKCDKYNDILQQNCIFQLVKQYPSKFEEKDCEKLNGFFYLQETWKNSCKSIINNSLQECLDFDKEDSSDKWIKICINHYFDVKNNQCKNEECMYNVCIDINNSHPNCCKYIKNPLLNNKCLAKTTLNYIYCIDMKDKNESKKCCNEMLVDKEECLEKLEESEDLEDVETIPEEEADDKDFRDRSSHCPYPVSDEAVWVEKGYGENWAEGYQENGKWV